MHDVNFTFTAKLWVYGGEATWYFITLPKKHAEEIKFFANAAMEAMGGRRRGFGSVRVEATIGKTRWQTSVFPDSQSGSYLLPIKAAVRKAENLSAGQSVKLAITAQLL